MTAGLLLALEYFYIVVTFAETKDPNTSSTFVHVVLS